MGVPLSTPAADQLSPAGREPELSDHVYGVVPPDAPKVSEYGVPTVPGGRGDVVVIESGVTRGAMVTLNVFSAVRGLAPESVTRTVKLNDPFIVGVPFMAPADDNPRPAGKEPEATDHA
jgi:hypothetical protein